MLKGCRLRRGEGRGARGRGGRERTPSPSQAGWTNGWKDGRMDQHEWREMMEKTERKDHELRVKMK